MRRLLSWFSTMSRWSPAIETGEARELRENLAALERGPLTEEEQGWMRELGRKVHG